MPRPVNAEQKTETQGQRQRPEVESEGGGEALGDLRQHRPLVLDAAQLTGEEVTHDEPVLLMQGLIEVEFLAKDPLHILRDFGIQLAPGIRTPRRQRDDEK